LTRVFVVDDHPIVRQGLVTLLEDEGDLQVVGVSDGTDSVAQRVLDAATEVLLLDLEMPGQHGIDVLKQLSGSAVRVVVFTAYDDEERVLSALRAGAQGYVLKGTASDDIVKAVRTVAAGGSFLEPRVSNKVLSQLRTPHQRTSLTPREKEVLVHIGEGLSNKEIGVRLTISERTVKFHINSLFNKLSANNRAHLVAAAIEQELLKPTRRDRW
jgi:DNA-binding NarL/FixJ family response regulator